MASRRERRRNESRGTNSFTDLRGSRSSPELNRSTSIGPRQYSYQQLAKATNHFSSNNLLGEGGFGQVYMGSVDGQSLAIKKLKNHRDLQSQGKLQDEIIVVSSVRHKNLVELVGYCVEGADKLLVLKYFPNKSLGYQLHESEESLDWKKRMDIAKSSARGLEYLHEHCDPSVIHLDIKSDNILLDDDFKPKVADFGLARFFSEAATHISESAIMGTKAYVDPYAIKTGQYSVKSDVYSFGVMLLELITGRRPIENGFDVVEWAKPKIKSALRNEEFEDFVDYTMHIFDHGEMYRMLFCIDVCINNRPKFRPSMKKLKVLNVLVFLMMMRKKKMKKMKKKKKMMKKRFQMKRRKNLKRMRTVTMTLVISQKWLKEER
uniref:non-specific serine/threonine protein kinase n=1 Tax=Manihot esculenta TaxID=3983 RepID=A0A199UBG1_MANES